ncbi:MAG: nucleotidyltransferase domain-containing protein [Pseudomonadota bacterium]
MSRDAVQQIDQTLQRIAQENHANIALAVESGSRAWGFASPDSDYDCRFIFIRGIDQYLSLSPPRDVIEIPIDPIFDINGWDLGKALKLMLKGNAVVIEWLQSPISYSGSEKLKIELLAFATKFASRELMTRHYLHLGLRQRRMYFGDGKYIPLKKIFYALRPATVLRWLRYHPSERVPPMHFPTLMEESEPPKAICDLVSSLMERKAQTRELGTEIIPYEICRYVDAEFEMATRLLGPSRVRLSREAHEEADAFFCRWVRKCATV